MPLAHTVELNAGTMDSDVGPRLQAAWTWAPSAMDHEQVNRLSQLWFEALAGICAHVLNGGGGLTPSDLAPARLSQQQIDELAQQHRIADVLPNEIAPYMDTQMDLGLNAMQKALGRSAA